MTDKKCIIFDIDGTIANIEHRRHFVSTKPKNWVAFEKGIEHDTQNDDVVFVLKHFADAGHTIILCSGRGNQQREKTVEWLQKLSIPFEKLYMRPEKDYRADDIIKSELLDQILTDGYKPFLAIDDRSRVVNMWRSRGIPCWQVRPGDF